ncbi:signal transduction histidine kinase [Flavobacterium enshiense DK69]|uniref:sensor histidine kinase n=1 Tax=Flavobacterium enshiense TaxID=1341165 RepID=UPI0003C5AFDD|nr:PAS domain S-box protein [Flavobacterium enshiense]ESU20364.1 signal transduction histidine kinase [Flavobacterium enshiense DK69]
MSLEKEITALNNWFLLRPKISGVLVFTLLFSILNLAIYFRYEVIRENEQRNMTYILNVVKQNIEQTLKSSYATTITLALTIDDSGNPKNFEEVGKQLVANYTSVDAVQLVPKGVIKYTYPLKGNEAAINFDILHHPVHRKSALRAIATKSIYFSGPRELIQGGMGVVGRLPVFKKGRFWGFSSVILKFDTFIKSTGIGSFKSDKYYFQFSKINPITHKEEFFLEDKSDFSKKNYQKVEIPEGGWNLYIIPKNESALFWAFMPVISIAFLLSLLCGFFVTTLLKKPSELQKLVEAQTLKLARSESLFKSIFEHAGLGITHNNSKDGSYIDANDKFCELIGYSKDEIKSMDFMKITHPEDLQADLDYMQRLKNGEINQFSMEKRYFDKNGKIIWVNITVTPLWEHKDNPTNHITIVEDITQRKESEKLILESQKKIKDLIDSIDGIVWEGNSVEPGVTFVSKKSEDILGYTPEEWLADKYFWRKIIHPDDRDWVIKQSTDNAKARKAFDTEYRIIAKNGNTVWVRDIVSIYHESVESIKFRGILIDITKSKQFEIDLNNSLTLVTEQNKRLLNFSHIVSHNLRSHTSNIQSLINLIEMSDNEYEKKELLVLLKSVSEALNETMDNLNEVVSIQTNITPVIEELNLNKFIKRTLEVLRNQIVKNEAKIENNISDDETVKFNPAYLESVLLNFLSNAIRYKHPERNPRIELNSYLEDNYRVVEIKDNGIGIDLDKNGNKLFGMYKTFTNNPESRGIGLFITKNQIDALKGKIKVESKLNEGTTFKIYFK